MQNARYIDTVSFLSEIKGRSLCLDEMALHGGMDEKSSLNQNCGCDRTGTHVSTDDRMS